MRKLFAALSVLLLFGCAEGELEGPGPAPDASSVPDSGQIILPDANTSQPDASPGSPDANTSQPDAATSQPDGGPLICLRDADCGANGCCLIAICAPLPGPCTP